MAAVHSGAEEELTEYCIVVRTEHHLVIVDQACKLHSNFFQLFLNGTQSPRHCRQELLMTRGKVCLQEGQNSGVCEKGRVIRVVSAG